MSKITIYTSETCTYCKQVKDKFEENKIEFKERTKENFEEQWYQITHLTGLPIFPTIEVSGHYLVPQRDFNNVDQLVNIVDYLSGSGYPDWSEILILTERVKTLHFSMNKVFEQIKNQLKNIESKL